MSIVGWQVVSVGAMQSILQQVHNGSPEEQAGLVSYNLLRHPMPSTPILWLLLLLTFFRPLLDHQSSPSSQIDRLRCSLPKATRSSRQLPAAPFMTNARILCFFLHKFSGPDCHL